MSSRVSFWLFLVSETVVLPVFVLVLTGLGCLLNEMLLPSDVAIIVPASSILYTLIPRSASFDSVSGAGCPY